MLRHGHLHAPVRPHRPHGAPNANLLATAPAEGAQGYQVGPSEHTGPPRSANRVPV